MKKEYRNLVSLKPVLMYREDILELYDLFEAQPDQEKEIQLEYNNSSENITISELSSLQSIANLPQTSQLRITIYVWGKQDDQGEQDTRTGRSICSGVSISLNFNNASYQLHSNNETWFLGTDSKLRKFFKAKRPWYSPIQRFSQFVCPVAVILSFQKSLDLVKGDEPTNGIFWIVLTMVLVAITGLIFSQKIFPYVWISLSGKDDSKFSYEKWTLIVSVLALAVAIISSLVQWSTTS